MNKTHDLLLSQLGIGREKNRQRVAELNLEVNIKIIHRAVCMWGGNWDMVISSKWWIYSILQYDEIAGGTDTWEDVCQQFGIDLASSGTETDNTLDSGSKGSEHEVENIDSSGVETDNTSDNGSKQGSEHEVDSSSFEEVRKRKKVKQRRVNKRKK